MEGGKVTQHKKKAKEENRTISYQDEAGFSLLPTCQVTYARKGQTPVLQHECKHYRKISAAVVITEDGDLYYEVRQCNFHHNAIVRFMNNCWADLQTALVCIWDNATIHKAKEVANALHQTHRNPRIRLENTPAYSPELNASEQVWNYVKNVLLVNVFCKTEDELKRRVIEALEEIKANKELVKSFFRNTKVGFYI